MFDIATAYILSLDISKSPVLNYKQMAYLYRMFPGNRLRELRKKAKLTQAQLAELTGVSQPAISQLENDTLTFNVEWMRTFARVFSDQLKTPIAPADLLSDADYPNRLTPEEEALIKEFRSAGHIQREMIQRAAEPIREFRHAPTDMSRNAA